MSKSFEEMVSELVDIETSAGCHEDYVEDYANEMEFHLSNVETDSYTTYVSESMDVDTQTAIKLQKAVIAEIKSRH